MLQIIKSDSPASKNIIIRELLTTANASLIVSDLQSKLYWQTESKNKVHRASEFWQILLKKNEAKLNFLDDQATLIRLQKELDQIPDSVYRDFYRDLRKPAHAELSSTLQYYENSSATFHNKKTKPKTLMNFFCELFPLFSHPNTAEIMQYWFDEQRISAPSTWEPLFYLCQSIWLKLKEENILPEKVISAYLLHTLNYEFLWKTPLIFDLGGNLQTIESELILTLSQQINVTVIEATPEWISDFHWLTWPYQQLKTRSYQEQGLKSLVSAKSEEENKYFRFTNPLSEVKMATRQIQTWLNGGINPNKIYVTAPNIEDYWPALKWHLENENLAYNREPRVKLSEILSLKKLIAQLKCSFFHSTEKKDLEAALFINEAVAPLKYAEFSQLYSELFSPKDYFRHPKVSNKLTISSINFIDSRNSVSSELSAEDFLQVITNLYPTTEVDNSLFQQLKIDFTSSVPAHFKVEIHYWIYYLEQFLQKREILLNKEASINKTNRSNDDAAQSTNQLTINIVPLASIYALTDYKAIFLGLNEASLKSNSSVISGSDVMSLLNKTGHLLDHPDRNYFEFLLQWSQIEKTGHIYSFAETDWQTEELTPSVFWLLGYTQMPTEIVPPAIEAAKLSPKLIPNLTPHPANAVFKNISISTGDIFKTLSPSGLEKLNDCAFKYYVERLLNLNEDRILDLDPSPLTLGSLYHKLCELLTVEPIRYLLTESEWSNVADKTLNSTKANELLDFQRTELKNKLIDWGKIFLANEQELQQIHPDSRVYGRELKFTGTINDIKFNGKIDRINWDQDNQFSIVDYKSSVSHLTGPLSWIKNNQLQLLCYVYAAEKGWINHTDGPPSLNSKLKVSGAYYLSMKNFDKKGFTTTDCKASFLSSLSSKSELSAEDLETLMTEFEEILTSAIAKLKSGNIEPIPRNESICYECSWSHLCRAPHLNM